MATADMGPLESVGSQLTLLHQVSGIVSSDMPLKGMLNELIGLVVRVTHCDACLVYLLDAAADDIALCASQLPHAREIGRVRMNIGEGVAGWVAQHRSVVALETRAYSDPRFKAFTSMPEDKFEALVSVPLISSGGVIGIVNVHHKEPRKHSADEVALLSYLAEQMGGAIAKASLSERSRAATRKVGMLAAVGHTITTEGYLDRILQVITEMVADTFDSPVCSIMIVEEDKKELVIKAARCASPEYLQKLPLKIEDSLIGQVVRNRSLVNVPDVAAEKSYRHPELARRVGINSLLSVPLIAGQKVIGTLNIYSREQRVFSEDDIGFARAVAGQIAVAFENARLMTETLEMRQVLESRKLVERAKGLLQRRNNMTEEEAYLELRGESRRLRRPMRDLAEAIILADEVYRKDGKKDSEGREEGAPHVD